MRIILIVLGFFALISESAWAQKSLVIEGGGTGKLYLTHSVEASEGLFAIGRKYNVDPKDLAVYNGLTANQGLSLGQKIKIPLTSANFSQELNASAKKDAVPVYYKVKTSEGMYRVSVNHNKVAYDVIKKWNGLAGESLSAGQELIIGYVTSTNSAITAANKPATVSQPVDKKEEARQEVKQEVVVTAEKTTQAVTQPVQASKTEQPEKPVVNNKPAVVKPADNAQVESKQPVYLPKGTSYFQSAYEDEVRKGRKVKTSTLSGGVFKSTSGWQDGKFYILMNNIAAGSLVRITNLANNKTIFAKVLGEVPDMKQNSGLSFRLSNAAAAELGASEENKFNVEVSF